jgi:excisionase family DNA binding protein
METAVDANDTPNARIAGSVEDASVWSGLSRAELWRHIRSGELPSVAVGRRRLVMWEDLRAWLISHRTAA